MGAKYSFLPENASIDLSESRVAGGPLMVVKPGPTALI